MRASVVAGWETAIADQGLAKPNVREAVPFFGVMDMAAES